MGLNSFKALQKGSALEHSEKGYGGSAKLTSERAEKDKNTSDQHLKNIRNHQSLAK